MSIAFIFPGQGAQTIGMGQELAASYGEAKAVFDEVDDALSQPLSQLIWHGDIEELTLTANAQPALMAMSMAVMAALKVEGIDVGKARYVAGHSLGEYSALCASGAMSISDTARILRARGDAMQSATPIGQGAMAAVLGLTFDQVKAVVEAASTEALICQAANDNDPGQVVISGHKEAVEKAIPLAKEAGAKRAILLPVSAPFHCALMAPARDKMAEVLANAQITSPQVPLVANVRAMAVSDPDEIRQLLIDQITGSVRWRESVSWMHDQGVTRFWEVGAGKALSGMVRRIVKGAETQALSDEASIKACISSI